MVLKAALAGLLIFWICSDLNSQALISTNQNGQQYYSNPIRTNQNGQQYHSNPIRTNQNGQQYHSNPIRTNQNGQQYHSNPIRTNQNGQQYHSNPIRIKYSPSLKTNRATSRPPNLMAIKRKQAFTANVGTSFRENNIRRRRSSIIPDSFVCKSIFLEIEDVCDGVPECPDGSDEADCGNWTCPTHYRRCNSGPCFLLEHQCDGTQHCADNSDEENCHNVTCPMGYFQCMSGQCIVFPFRCDGKPDCNDTSDEFECQNMTCPDGYYNCSDGRCISLHYKCDSEYVLWDAIRCSDEFEMATCDNYTCVDPENTFQCNNDGYCQPMMFHCNGGFAQCTDGSDESSCENNTCRNPWPEFRCKVSGQCIFLGGRCNGVDECQDGTDESDCDTNDCGSEMFTCPNGECIDWIYVCDGQEFCFGGGDEDECDERVMPACSLNEYQCRSGHCISITSALCDGYYQGKHSNSNGKYVTCPIFHEDETQCPFMKCPSDFQRLETGGCQAVDPSNRKCAPGISNRCPSKCPSSSYIQCCNCKCVHRVSICDGVNDCPDGGDERNCGKPDCRPDQFYCGDIMCFPSDLRCDGVVQCVDEHDETDCKLNQTSSFTKNDTNALKQHTFPTLHDTQHACFDPSICLSPETISISTAKYDVHFDHSNCFIICSTPCECFPAGIMKCNQWRRNGSLTSDSDMLWPFNTSYLPKTVYNFGNTTFLFIDYETGPTYFTFQRILMLSITQANLTQVPRRLLVCAFNIHHLDLSHNKIGHISVGDFGRLYRLSVLDLSNNLITKIDDFSFKGLRVLHLKLESNLISDFGADLFSGMAPDGTIVTDEFRFCCLTPAHFPKSNCYPKADQFSSCEDLMKNSVLAAFLWIIGFLALIGNILVLVSNIFIDRDSLQTKYGVLVTNLAVADVLMAFYLLSIASVDVMYRGHYATKDVGWRTSPLCSIVGVVCMVSSEASVLFISLITLDRYLIVKYPFKEVEISRSKLIFISVCIWIGVVLAAVLPVAVTPYFKGKFFNKSGVCIALPLTTDAYDGWQYAFAISVCFNFVLFLIVFVGQWLIYTEIARSQRRSLVSTKRIDEFKIAKKLMFVVLSDFCCWVPIGVMGIMAVAGVEIPAAVYAWVIVIVVPINSALNPFLYTGLTLFYDRCRE